MSWTRILQFRRPAPPGGAGLLPFTALLVLLFGCGGSPEVPPDPEVEGARALGLKEGARLHRVILGGRGAEEHVLPPRVLAVPGDGVEFVTVDHRVHTLDFPGDSLTPEARAFLNSSGGASIPPLLSKGSRYILRLEGAPRGRYPFVSRGHGGVAHGFIEVGQESDSLASGGG